MPTVKDKSGNIISKQPYTTEGIDEAERIASKNPNWDIANIPSYDAGGRIKNIEGYGEEPSNLVANEEMVQDEIDKDIEPQMMKKGGEVKKLPSASAMLGGDAEGAIAYYRKKLKEAKEKKNKKATSRATEPKKHKAKGKFGGKKKKKTGKFFPSAEELKERKEERKQKKKMSKKERDRLKYYESMYEKGGKVKK